MPPTALYTPENCTFAFQLRWAITLFWNAPIFSDDWISELRAATACDGVKILRHRFIAASARKQHLLSRLGIVRDHLHMTLGIHPEEAPGDVALSYMNNIAFALGMQPVLMQSCFIGGFGSYDLGAVEGR